ncbi:MAG: D-alanine--D-alanine ligase [Alphaproteobacteria bacterium]|jgi:D-alanine-D-alanine ligase|nr:D-alanine--D-alanine ligase [Alphaproteobacteria bacterium]MBT4966948.1 D-alanine--D-alanine ligase [Alphaproteobacteria bacterium]MBT5160854.1 D-alanine--D-alanine ligase [Alphaproteobacteria bacterium]MBT5919629.1 D-alanine--D-alanine ligase [Alphaproteobacteria bacterium]MBT6386187.1 D-alanine--D-alanine ligase [Alphaproteobacteria bacterium]
MKKHVAVLMGGWSAEREVSLVSGAAVVEALQEKDYRVSAIDVGHTVATTLADMKPDVCFNALHGRFGEDGCIQGVLETLGIPYTHSGVLASAMAMDKPLAKKLYDTVGLPCVEGGVFHRDQILAGDVMTAPYVIKPLNEGSSVGVKIVTGDENELPFQSEAWHYGSEVLVERYVPGREVQVAVLDNKALGAIEIRPTKQFYDYEAKYSDGFAEHLMPAPIDKAVYDDVMQMAETAHKVLGCRGVTRTDFRYDDTAGEPGKLFILETNTQPGMTPLSLTPEIAAHRGMDFGQLVDWLVKDASCQR